MVGVYQKACPELVDIVEAGEADSPRAEEVLRRDLDDIVRLGADTLVLGCTHYPLLKPAIRRLYPGSFTLVDSATTTAAKVERHLDHSRLRAAGAEPRHEILVTAVPHQFDRIAANIFGDAVRAQEVQLWEKQTT
jgi:glutamate racemase